MCGITGFYSPFLSRINSDEFSAFNSSLSHRGPDFSNIMRAKYSFLGHSRLSIIDLSANAHQPYTATASGINFSITFNGEIYNYIEIREELKSLGHTFKTLSDTEVVLKSYIEWGEKCYSKFNGMWALAIYNHSTHDLHVSRDRFGVKPLYLYFIDMGIFFASEIKAFASLPASLALTFDRILIKFLAKRPDNRSKLTKPISCLPAGHCLTINKSLELKFMKWWHLENHINSNSSFVESELNDEFHDLLISAIKLRTRSDAKICSSLSGGLDSSTIVSVQSDLLEKEQRDDYKAFIFEYNGQGHSELEYALSVCSHSNMPHTLISQGPGGKELNPQLLEDCIFSSEQLENLQIGPYLLYQSMQSEGYKVSIDGHGADEILGGYPQFAIPSLADAFVSGGSELFEETLDAWKSNDKSYMEQISFDYQRITQLIKEKHPTMDGMWMTRKRKHEFQSKTLPWILNTFDKLPMRHGIEVRSPFLDYRLVSFAFSLPNQYLVGNGYTKKILRQAFIGYLPKKVFTRKSKKGFLPSKDFLFKDSAVRKIINDVNSSAIFRASNFFDGDKVSRSIEKALQVNDLKTLSKFWPLIQTTIFATQWKKHMIL